MSAKTKITARAGSWMALLAATTLGVSGGTVRAEVRASDNEIVDGDTYRLVVQTYDGPVARANVIRTSPAAVAGVTASGSAAARSAPPTIR